MSDIAEVTTIESPVEADRGDTPSRHARLPFAHLNLRRNPFGELTLSERVQLAVLDVEPYVNMLEAGRVAIQLTGPPGVGKTTHLLAIHHQLHDSGYVHVHEGEIPEIPAAPFLCLDDVHFLPRRIRRRVFRQVRGVALTTHRELGRELRRAGFRVERVDRDRKLDTQVLARIIELRIEAARRSGGPVPRVPAPTVSELIRRFGNDVRSIEWFLYERFQTLKEVCDVQV